MTENNKSKETLTLIRKFLAERQIDWENTRDYAHKKMDEYRNYESRFLYETYFTKWEYADRYWGEIVNLIRLYDKYNHELEYGDRQ